MTKKLSKYIAAFDYFHKNLIVLSASRGISVTFFKSVFLASASFSLVFSLTTGVIKKLLKTTRNNKKKHSKIVMLAKSKLNSIETLISQALIVLEISHGKYKTNVNENEKYVSMKESIRNIKTSNEKDELTENSKNNRENNKNI